MRIGAFAVGPVMIIYGPVALEAMLIRVSYSRQIAADYWMRLRFRAVPACAMSSASTLAFAMRIA